MVDATGKRASFCEHFGTGDRSVGCSRTVGGSDRKELGNGLGPRDFDGRDWALSGSCASGWNLRSDSEGAQFPTNVETGNSTCSWTRSARRLPTHDIWPG